MAIPINLFEFVNYSWNNSDELKVISELDSFSDDLEKALDKIWVDRKQYSLVDSQYFESNSKKQRFIEFKKDAIVPRNWIGTIHIRSNNEDFAINLLPKLFYKENHKYTTDEIDSIFAHILWWLSGSEKQSFSTLENSLSALESNFLEIFVYIFSRYTLDIFSTTTYHYYDSVFEELGTIRGSIDFNGYVNNYSIGNKHILPCVFDSFQFDNLFNRIVKYVCTILKDFTCNTETKRNLEEVLFLLDDVQFVEVKPEDCEKVVLNPIYTEYKVILDNCNMFLSSLSVYKWKDDFSVFALLIKSEELFENFIYSTIKNNAIKPIVEVSRKRPGRNFLVRQRPSIVANRFKMINDVVIRLEDNSHILFDTKYKKISITTIQAQDNSQKNNISQSDIYQMVSYSVSSGVSDIGLIYPDLPFEKEQENMPIFEIVDEFNPEIVIRIHLFKIDIIHKDVLNVNLEGKLENIFKETNQRLINQLNESVNNIWQQKNLVTESYN